MAKSGGLGQSLFVSGYDLSGDTQSWQANGGPNLGDFTGINKSAMERLGLLFSGGMNISTFFNDATAQAHPVYRALPTADVILSLLFGDTLGNYAICLNCKQVGYDGSRAQDGMFTLSVPAQSNAKRMHICESALAGDVTHASATNGTGIDGGTQGAQLTVAGGSAANPTVVTITAHGLVTGDSIVIAGTDKAALNTNHTVTVTGANTFTVPVDLSGGAASAGTAYKTSTNFGLSAYLHVMSIASGTNVVKYQDSADNSTFADITGGTFTGATGRTSEMIETTNTRIVRRYVRAISSDTFTNCLFWTGFIRHLALSID